MELFHSADFPSHVEKLMKEHHVPGLAISVVQNETVASAGFGHASLIPPKLCTPDTLFDIASASKSLTAASVGLLVSDDQKYPDVKYDAMMSTLLPDDFVMSGEGYTEGVTVEDILSHRSGLPRSYLGPRAAQPDDPRSVTRSIRELPVAVPIRSKFIYCNIMYTVASYLVEKKSALSFSDFLQENFFRPLAMNSTHLQPEQSRANGLSDLIATGYSWDKEKEAYKGGFQSPDAPEAQGAGSIISSVSDYIKWVKAMMNNENPITLEVYKGLTKARIIENPSGEEGRPLTSPIAYAAGWEISYYRGYQVIKHDGSIPGFGTCHFFVPDFKFGGAIFGNSGGAGTISSILMRELIDQALNVPQAERLDWNKIESEADSDNDEDDEEKLREELCPGITSSQPQELSLDAYIGEYSNPGYHSLTVKVNDGKLFIDATDRSMGFTLTFDHVCEQTKYIVHMSDSLEGGDIPFKAEFNLDSGKATKMGLHFEDELKEYIWFNRV